MQKITSSAAVPVVVALRRSWWVPRMEVAENGDCRERRLSRTTIVEKAIVEKAIAEKAIAAITAQSVTGK